MTQTVMARHTEGPWELDDSEKYYRRGAIRRNGMVVAFMNDNWQPITAEERLANARLIAAAPDMLEALRKVQGYFAPVTHVGDVQMRDEVRAAIAKATGGQDASQGYTREMAQRDEAERYRRDRQ